MRFDPSPALSDAQLNATAAFLDGAAQPGYVELYAGTAPTPGTGGGTPLVTLTLPRPLGTANAGVLHIPPGPQALIMQGGMAAWARWYRGDGQWAGDSDVSDEIGGGFIRLEAVGLIAGGKLRLLDGYFST